LLTKEWSKGADLIRRVFEEAWIQIRNYERHKFEIIFYKATINLGVFFSGFVMIVSETKLMEADMHILLLIVVVPFAVLFAGLGLFGLTVIMSFFIQFPLALLVVLGIGVLRHYLVNLGTKRGVPCEQV